MKPGYKQTEIGKIPEEWEMVRLGEVVNYSKGRKPNIILEKHEKSFEPYLTAESMRTGVFNLWCEIDEDVIKVKSNDIIFIWDGSFSGDVFTGFCGVLASTMVKIDPRQNNLDKKYLFYFLKTKFKLFNSTTTGTSIPHISKSIFTSLKLPLPPLPEQQRIAEVLSTVDSAIKKTAEIITKTQALKKGLMQQLLTRGIGHTKFKQTEIGKIPEEWEVVRLGSVAKKFISGGTPSTSKPEYWNGKIPWMRSAHIKGRFVDWGEKYISEEGFKNSATNLVPGKNILVATRVCIGRVAINKIDIAISQDLTGVVVDKDKVNFEYLYWTLLYFENTMKSWTQGSTIKGVLRNDLQNLKLPLPPLPEQQKIAEILSAVDEKIEAGRKKKEKLEQLKKGLMQDLLTGRVRVKYEA
ncbi:TPA: restriction endonuclease [bacterium]|nr:restriction endonuclease [bacterium]